MEPPKSLSIFRKSSDMPNSVVWNELPSNPIQEEMERQEQVCEAARQMALSVLELKEHERATFYSPSENRCLPGIKILNLRNENLLSILARWCKWSSMKDLSDVVMDILTELQSYDSHHRQWRSADVWRGNGVRHQCCRSESFSKTDVLMSGSMIKSHI